MNEDDLLNSYFNEKDIPGVTPAEFQMAVAGLIEKGLMEEILVEGVRLYRPTPLLRKIKTHINSDPKTQS
jgi:hypothetical protein